MKSEAKMKELDHFFLFKKKRIDSGIKFYRYRQEFKIILVYKFIIFSPNRS